MLPVQSLALTKHLGNISSRRPGVSYSRGTYPSVHVHMCACSVLTNAVRHVRPMLVSAGVRTPEHGLDVSASSARDRDVINMGNVQACVGRSYACISVVMHVRRMLVSAPCSW